MRISAILILLFFSCSNPKNVEVNLIPKPQYLKITEGVFLIDFSTGLDFDSVFISEGIYLKKLINLPLNGQRNTIKLKHREGLNEEEFLINITKKNLIIEATTNEGAMRGIQTLRQLMPYKKSVFSKKIPCLQIHDFPRFKWRGMLLDCCRHFMDKEFIKRYIDLLAYHKMNILHWHLTEDQGWRIEIDKYPELTNIGAWRKEKDGSVYGGFYSKEDVREILDYAKTRHIKIVPEIELPGHSSAAIASYPYLSCSNDSIDVANEWGVFKDIYCAGNDSVFEFIENVLQEVIDLFPSDYIHIGGDEAPKFKWENCRKCQKRIEKENLDNEHELQSYFIKRVERFLNKNNKKLIGWDEILEGGLAPSATVQSWRGLSGGINAAKNGHDAIMSPTSHCYFDYALDAIDMKKVYYYEPIPKELSKKESKHILGAECNMWTERAPQELIDSKVFPRILAMCEILWSSKEKDYMDFYNRVQKHYSKLDAMGVDYGFESVPITSKILFDKDSFSVSLKKGSPDMTIEYSINESGWKKYTDSFNVNETVVLTARGIKQGNPYGVFRQKLIKHLGTGKSVNYLMPYNLNYTGTGDYNLTDGLTGSTNNFRDGYYQGFFGTDVEIIINLEEITELSEISTSFFQYHLSWILLPAHVTYSVSIDGKKYEEIGTLKNSVSAMKEGKFKNSFILKTDKITAKFLKVYAKNFGKLPEKHPAAGSDSWIFIDEVIIN